MRIVFIQPNFNGSVTEWQATMCYQAACIRKEKSACISCGTGSVTWRRFALLVRSTFRLVALLVSSRFQMVGVRAVLCAPLPAVATPPISGIGLRSASYRVRAGQDPCRIGLQGAARSAWVPSFDGMTCWKRNAKVRDAVPLLPQYPAADPAGRRLSLAPYMNPGSTFPDTPESFPELAGATPTAPGKPIRMSSVAPHGVCSFIV
jgi:hypothetical protein